MLIFSIFIILFLFFIWIIYPFLSFVILIVARAIFLFSLFFVLALCRLILFSVFFSISASVVFCILYPIQRILTVFSSVIRLTATVVTFSSSASFSIMQFINCIFGLSFSAFAAILLLVILSFHRSFLSMRSFYLWTLSSFATTAFSTPFTAASWVMGLWFWAEQVAELKVVALPTIEHMKVEWP